MKKKRLKEEYQTLCLIAKDIKKKEKIKPHIVFDFFLTWDSLFICLLLLIGLLHVVHYISCYLLVLARPVVPHGPHQAN